MLQNLHVMSTNAARRTKCCNLNCSEEFSLTVRRRVCMRCGKVFCKKCSKYKKKLTITGANDPFGQLFNVCLSCLHDPQSEGQTRSWTQWYKELVTNNQNGVQDTNSTRESNCVSFERECARLTEGFKMTVGTSELRSTLVDLLGTFTTWEWQKSPRRTPKKSVYACQVCSRHLLQLYGETKKVNCSLCGVVACRRCHTDDKVIVYLDDCPAGDFFPSITGDTCTGQEPKLAVTGVVGCPSVEPDRCVYLKFCVLCQSRLQREQIAEYNRRQNTDRHRPTSDDIMVALEEENNILQKMKQKIEIQLPYYQDLVEALELRGSFSAFGPPSSQRRSSIQILAKYQGDLSDNFAKLSLHTMKLSKMRPSEHVQQIILKNITKSAATFYQDYKFRFVALQNILSDFAPSEVLESIRHYVEEKALCVADLYLQQLGRELLTMSDSSNICYELAKIVADTQDVVGSELRECLQGSTMNEDWDSYSERASEMLQYQIKNKRLLRPCPRQLASRGDLYLRLYLFARVDSVLDQVSSQLEARCIDRRFGGSKAALRTASGDSLVKLAKSVTL